MPRLFVALGLPSGVRDSLAAIACGLPGADWVDPEQYHLTLRFLGEVDAAAFAGLRSGLASVSARSFFLTLRGLGVFPLRGAPETLWAGVERNEGLIRLRNRIESLLARQGQPRESRKFHPHVTLARVRSVRPEWVGAYVAGHSLFAAREIPVQSFALYSSKLTSRGPEYAVEGEYPLEGLLEGE
jgi:2'-5' RNA ligase